MAGNDSGGWIAAAAAMLVRRGSLTLISRADRLADILAALQASDCGDITVRAVHSRADEPALRILVAARKGVKGVLVMLPPLILRDNANQLTPEMTQISNHCAELEMTAPGRQRRHPQLPGRQNKGYPSS